MKKFGTAKPPRTVIYQREHSTRRLFRREAITNEPGVSGTRSLSDGVEEFWYEVSIDRSDLETLARKAASNASLTAKAGPLVIRVLARKKVDAAS